MERRTTSWHSPNLNMEMPLVAYDHAGQTLLMLHTAAADYLEYERFYLVDASAERERLSEKQSRPGPSDRVVALQRAESVYNGALR